MNTTQQQQTETGISAMQPLDQPSNIVAYAVHLDGAAAHDYTTETCALWTRDPSKLGDNIVEVERIARDVHEVTPDEALPELITIVRADFTPDEWLSYITQGIAVDDSDAAVRAWWDGPRERCPRCGDEDVSTWGETALRTDANAADHAACDRASSCGWHSERNDYDAADREAIKASVDGVATARMLNEDRERNGLEPYGTEGVDLTETNTGPDAEFIGAGDDVIILDSRELGVLLDVEGNEACVRLTDGSLTYRPFRLIAHRDSPAATR